MPWNNQDTTEESKEKKNTQKKIKWKLNDSKPLRCSKSSSKKEVYNNTILPQETTQISNKQPNLTNKAAGERRNEVQS